MSGIVGISDVISLGGINQTLVVNAINGLLIIVMATVSSLVIDRFNRIQLLRWTVLIFALIFIGLLVLSSFESTTRLSAALLYLMSQQQWLVFPMFFWVLSNDIFEVSQAKRLIPVIGSWSFIGKVIGIGITLLPTLLFQLGAIDQRVLTIGAVSIINAAIYLLCFALITVGLGKIKLRDTSQQTTNITETLSEGWGFVREVPAYSFLLIALVAKAACDVVVEFRFFSVAKAAFENPVDYKQFYSLYLLAAALISFAIQGFITSRILKRYQLKNIFFIQPIVALGTTVAMMLSSGLAVAATASNALKISRNTIDESAQKSFQGLIPEERRGRVALLLDNYGLAFGYIFGCLLVGAVLYLGSAIPGFDDFQIYLGLTALVALGSLWAIFKMRTVYETSMLNWRLKRRKRGNAVLSKLEF